MTEHGNTDSFVDTPRGIFAANGLWFRTTLASLQEFAGEVLEKEPINELIDRSAIIYRSPKAIGLWVLIAALIIAPIWLAVSLSLLSYLLWTFIRRSIGGHLAAKALGIMENVGLQAIAFAAALIWLAMWPDIAKVVVGLLGFIAFRWNLVDMIFKPIVEKKELSVGEVGIPDQILRAVIVRSAIRHRISLDYLGKMEESMKRAMGLKN